MRIVMADHGVTFDGPTLAQRAFGGAESAFVWLAEALAARGHSVECFALGAQRCEWNGVAWSPLEQGCAETADLFIANRSNRVLTLCPQARRTAFWLHNPGRYILKPRYLWPIWRRRPVLVFTSAFHSTTCPGWVPGGGRVVIPMAPHDVFRHAAPDAAPDMPPPRAVFTSTPERALDRLLDLWEQRIRPAVPAAELHIYSGALLRSRANASERDAASPLLQRARDLAPAGVRLHAPLPRPELAAALAGLRVYLNPGAEEETYCFAAAEAQAVGLPGVVRRDGCMPERVLDGVTGFVVAPGDDAAFAEAALRLLQDDGLWRRQHAACLTHQRARSWNDVAEDFEALAP